MHGRTGEVGRGGVLALLAMLGVAGLGAVVMVRAPRGTAERPRRGPEVGAPVAEKRHEAPPVARLVADSERLRRVVEKLCEAEAAERVLLLSGLETFRREFAAQWEKGAEKFADEVTGLKMKWWAVKDRERFRKEVEAAFERTVMPRKALEAMWQRAFGPLDAAFEADRERLARAWLPGVPEGVRPGLEGTGYGLGRAENDGVRKLVLADLGANLASELVAELAVVGVGYAIGASSAWWTLGAGLVVGVVVDLVTTSYFEAEITKTVQALVGEAEAAVIHDSVKGLQVRLGNALERAIQQRKWALVKAVARN